MLDFFTRKGPSYQAHNGYQAISDGREGGNPLVFIEAKNPCNGTVWYVPGTHPIERIKASAPYNWAFDGYLDFDLPLDRVDETAINVAQTMVWHAPTVGTYSVWMIPGTEQPD